MLRAAALVLAALLTACPERATPESGLALTFRKPDGWDDVRATVDRRLARLKLKARVQEDANTLVVRLPGGEGAQQVKALLALRGDLQFCAEDDTFATAWCDRAWPAGIEVVRGPKTCGLSSASREVIDAALADGGVTLAWEAGARPTAYASQHGSCFAPHLTAATPTERDGMRAMMVEFDRASARTFEKFTTDLVHRRLLIVLDDVVTSAPIVQSPIPGGKAMLVLGRDADAALLAAVLAGGPLPALVLTKEGAYGPPSLTGK